MARRASQFLDVGGLMLSRFGGVMSGGIVKSVGGWRVISAGMLDTQKCG